MYTDELQAQIRADVFRWLDERLAAGQYEFRRAELLSYRYGELPVPLVDRQKGIWNPRDFRSTLSIVSMLKSKYADDPQPDSALQKYDYRSDGSSDNRKVRVAFTEGDPMVLFKEVRDGFYVAQYPAFVVGDDPISEVFTIALDESLRFFGDPLHMTGDERRYAERLTRTRLHQPVFRARVMHAYSETCAICSLRHKELLDAAHIVADSSANGFATTTNGLALCKIHHASYDRNLLGISPDYEIRIDNDLLNEIDGPMLRHGLQDMHGALLVLPRKEKDYPSKDALAEKFAEFAS